MLRPTSEFSQVEATLADEADALDLLAGILERERSALAAGLGDAVESLAAEKERHAERLARLGESREALLASHGVSRGMPELLERAPQAAQLHAAWRRLAGKARAAHSLNRENGLLIGTHARHLQARLAALAAASPGATYGPDGVARPRGQRRALGAA